MSTNNNQSTVPCPSRDKRNLEEKARIYQPQARSVIIKLMGKEISYLYLRAKLIELWKPTENLVLIDLGHESYIAKFREMENMNKAL